ncbi:hypothetical protein BZB76_4424 [Actinomadura pelletieri DSM 43383]|uniref:Uncharacterized protein n=1 Tax=Actinomadura pelletieri DSM 43383 TaxID=1120940 RepID=A0A495QMR1_9ACTN|nr:hypothetical protein [Actinomadura pelletieri]RKS73721.1 hypothetical protein BZB76_4424 [Actinomadura pelletieri DSM 43383]
MYYLQAAIATEHVLRELVGQVAEAGFVPLNQGLWLLPMTDALFDTITVPGAPELDGFWKAPAGFERMLITCSEAGPVAYVEADYFGGVGTQAAQVWDMGKVALGPLHKDVNEPFPPTGSPISQALRRLGVAKGRHFDEFDAVGLPRHRDTDDWFSRT